MKDKKNTVTNKLKIVIMITVIFLSGIYTYKLLEGNKKEAQIKINKKEVFKDKDKMIAIMYKDSTTSGIYKEWKSTNRWPDKYKYKLGENTGCLDIEGEIIPNSIEYDTSKSNPEAKVTATGTIGCYLYFEERDQHKFTISKNPASGISTIRYRVNGGTQNSTTNSTITIMLYEESKIEFSGVANTGYTMNGSNPTNYTMGTSDYSVELKATPITYSISYSLNGGTNSSYNPSTYNIETNTIYLYNPSRTGYTFNGWSPSGTIPKGSYGNKSFTASWSPITYSISYYLNGGTNSSYNPSTYNIETNTIYLSSPSKTGYTFNGWSPSSTIPKGSSGNKSFTASWSPITYSISYYLNGGTNSSYNPSSYTIESSTINLYNPSRSDYNFKGWYTDSYFNYPISSIPSGSTGDKSLYAKWEQSNCKLVVKASGSISRALVTVTGYALGPKINGNNKNNIQYLNKLNENLMASNNLVLNNKANKNNIQFLEELDEEIIEEGREITSFPTTLEYTCGTTVSVYGEASSGYSMSKCKKNSPCTATVNNTSSPVEITVSSTKVVEKKYEASVVCGACCEWVIIEADGRDDYDRNVASLKNVPDGTKVYYKGEIDGSCCKSQSGVLSSSGRVNGKDYTTSIHCEEKW